MPAWLEVLLNVIGFAGFIGIAKITRRPAENCRIAEGLTVRLIGLGLPASRADQPVGLEQHMAIFRLRPQRKADDDEGSAKQQPHHHHTPVGRSVRVMK
jgi:hypothetical protein